MEKLCSVCRDVRPAAAFNAHPKRLDGLQPVCKRCTTGNLRAWRIAHPEEALWRSARTRAKADGRAFALAVADIVIPAHCPLTGVELKIGGGRGPASASLDCLIPALGYVPGNVWTISIQANRLKNGITPPMMRRVLAEIEARGLEASA